MQTVGRLPQQTLLHAAPRPRFYASRLRPRQTPSHLRFLVPLAALNLDALSIPDIDGDLRSIQESLGAVFDDTGVARTFQNAGQVIDAVQTGVVLVDRSAWGRIHITGSGRTSFLHNQSTNDFNSLKPGQGCDTVFVTSTGRILDLASVLVGQSHMLVLVSPSAKDMLLQRFDKYIFPADDVKVQDVSARCAMMSLMGPEAENILKELGGDALTIIGAPYGTHQLLNFKDAPLIVAVGSGLASPGFTLIVDESVAGDLFLLLAEKGCCLMGEDEWHIARVMAGRPAAGAELTEDFNPLEAGLYHAVSVNKGCYIGQETLSKLHNLDGVKQQLWGLKLQQAAAVGADITSNWERIGRVTSTATAPDGQHWGLGYLRCKVKGVQVPLEGVSVEVAGAPATVVSISFASRRFASEQGDGSDAADPAVLGPGAESIASRAAEARRLKEAERAAEEAAKAERLKAMQERLAAWQAQQLAVKRAAAGEQDTVS